MNNVMEWNFHLNIEFAFPLAKHKATAVASGTVWTRITIVKGATRCEVHYYFFTSL